MSIMCCDGCGRKVDTDEEELYQRKLATGQEDIVNLCLDCDDFANAGHSLEEMKRD